jgi:hypothetical protein
VDRIVSYDMIQVDANSEVKFDLVNNRL